MEFLFLTVFYANIYIIQQIFEAFSSTVIRYCPLLKLFFLAEKIFGANLFGGGSGHWTGEVQLAVTIPLRRKRVEAEYRNPQSTRYRRDGKGGRMYFVKGGSGNPI